MNCLRSVFRRWLLATVAASLLTACDPVATIVLPEASTVGTSLEFRSELLPQYQVTEFPDMQYEWVFGDGTSATGPQVQHAYAQPGIYEVILNITDTNTRAFGQARVSKATIKIEAPAYGTTFHIRTDGGTGEQCNGKANARYPGAGQNQDCAWISPMVALPSQGPLRMAGGDTLIIHSGQYLIGLGAPAGTNGCSKDFPWDCSMQDVPSGPDSAHPTQILGEGHDSGCSQAPQLWGNERVHHVLGLSKANNVKLACLEVTDHAPCVQFHSQPSVACHRDTPPFGPWAAHGLYAVDSSNVQLTDINIHGLSNSGLTAGRIKDWTLTGVRIAANGWVGWDGDVGKDTSSNSGTIKFSHVTIEWNGCAETVGTGQPAPTACWAQSAGGYGDGLGTAATGGHWVIEDSAFLHNTSDGLDLLYANGTGTITLKRIRAEGNAGNQIKVAGPSTTTNAIVIGNCNHFSGQPFTYSVDPCRAGGDTVALLARSAADVLSMTNSTLVGEGNVVVLTDGPLGSLLKLQNNVFIAKPGFYELADVYWNNDNTIVVEESGNLKQNLRNAKCTTPAVICGAAGLANDDMTAFDPHLRPDSLARDSGTSGPLVPFADYFGAPRPGGAGPDRGAVEFK
jgi:PKD domain